MSFHLAQTPTLEAVAIEDEKLLARDLQARVEEAATQAREAAEVVEAIAGYQAAEERFGKLRASERALNQQAKEARERMEQLATGLVDAMIESADSKADSKRLGEMVGIETRVRFAARAIEKLTEHLLPLAQIASLREESHALAAECRALEQAAQERAQKVLGQIRAAVSDEMVLPVDLSKGVSGALLARARALKARAVQVSENADRLEKMYQDRFGGRA
jgi:hypothetical protein